MNIFNAIGTIFNDVICYPLGFILHICYKFTGSYAISLILFTLITRVALFPLALKQQKSSAEMVRMKPKLDKLQKKYAKDKEKLNAEMMKLYQEENYNPMSGCLPMLVQLPIIWGLFNVVYNPLKYMLWMNSGDITKTQKILHNIMVSLNGTKKADFSGKDQIFAAQAMNGHMDMLPFLPHNIKPIDFNLFGLNLASQPKLAFDILVLIPVLCYITNVISSWLSIRMNKAIQPANGGMNNITMILILPLMSTWFSLQVPAAVGFYWIITNIFMIVQVGILTKFFSPQKLAKQAEERAALRKADVLNGKVKKGKWAQITQQAMKQLEAQKEEQQKLEDKSSDDDSDEDSEEQENKPAIEAKQQPVRQNNNGKKSRSQLKEENRKKLAESRAREAKKKNDDE